MSESGVGDDNRTAVSDEEVEAAWRVHIDEVRIDARSDRSEFEAGFRAARRDVPGGREALRELYDRMTKAESELRAMSITATGSETWRLEGKAQGMSLARSYLREAFNLTLASHPLERADSEGDA